MYIDIYPSYASYGTWSSRLDCAGVSGVPYARWLEIVGEPLLHRLAPSVGSTIRGHFETFFDFILSTNHANSTENGAVAEWSNAIDSKSILFGGARSNRACVETILHFCLSSFLPARQKYCILKAALAFGHRIRPVDGLFCPTFLLNALVVGKNACVV